MTSGTTSHPSKSLFLSPYPGRADHHFLPQCGCHSPVCHQCGQQHCVRHDTTTAGHLFPDAFCWLPSGLHPLCSLPAQSTVGSWSSIFLRSFKGWAFPGIWSKVPTEILGVGVGVEQQSLLSHCQDSASWSCLAIDGTGVASMPLIFLSAHFSCSSDKKEYRMEVIC